VWVYVSMTYCCVRLDGDSNGKIIDAAPIIRWCIGKKLDWFKLYLKRKGVLLEWIEFH